MTYADKSLDQIRAEMNARYADGSAYAAHCPWDLDRHHLLIESVVRFVSGKWAGGADRACGDALDVGCAGGGMVDLLPSPTRYVGLDISDDAVRLAAVAHPNGQYVQGAVETTNWVSEFDTVIAIESIEHWANVSDGLAAVKRALRPNGIFVVTTPNRDSLHVTIGKKLGIDVPYCSFDHVKEFGFDELIGVVTGAGFRRLDSTGVGLMPYWALEREFGNRIRKLTDNDADVYYKLNRAGAGVPSLAFLQVHVFAAS